MSSSERQNLLEKLRTQSALSDEPLFAREKDTATTKEIEMEYSDLPWFYRVWYFFLSIFKSRSPIKIFEDSQVHLLGNKIESRSPGLYDYHNATLLPVFYRQIGRLKEAAHFFYSALDSSVNRDKGAFFAFLGSLEMPDVHKHLQDGTDPELILEKNKDTPVAEMRQIALKSLDEAYNMILEDHRNAMYFDARTLYCLKELSSFLYDRVLMAFTFNNAVNGETCSAGTVRDLLLSLNNILNSLRAAPPITLLESLFVFILQDKAEERGFDINREIRLLSAKAENYLTVIRDFNKNVPLTWILRCSTRNMSLSPKEVSGGEDWFVVFRDYWKRRAESLCADYIKDHHQRELTDIFRDFFKGNELKQLANTQIDSDSDGMPISGAFALAFLNTFYSVVFMPDLNWILRPILIDGEFQKKENRLEYTEGYNNLIKLDDEIKKFEFEISPTVEYGQRYAQARQEMSSLPIKRRKMQLVLEEAEEDAKKILGQARDAAMIMVNILGGILGKESKGKFFPLTNLTKISGKDNNFILGMGEAIQTFQTVLNLMEEMDAIENPR